MGFTVTLRPPESVTISKAEAEELTKELYAVGLDLLPQLLVLYSFQRHRSAEPFVEEDECWSA